MNSIRLLAAICTFAFAHPIIQAGTLASPEEMLGAQRDVWGEAAMAQTNGASYEFFEPLLPPPRYVNTDFRFYPIVLSAPRASVKARLISNGSGVNLRGGTRAWNDNGAPVIFRVGPDESLFGDQWQRLSHPTLLEGFLPIVTIRYLHPTPIQSGGNVPLNQTRATTAREVYQVEAFASVDPAWAEYGVVFAKFSLAEGLNGLITVEVSPKGETKFAKGKAADGAGQVLAYFDSAWKWERQSAHAKIGTNRFAFLAIPTRPVETLGQSVSRPLEISAALFEEQKKLCATLWKKMLAEGMHVETPEPIVNDAWRHLLIQNFGLINGDRIHYSHGNQYDKLYEAEGSDAALAMMAWGYEAEMRRLIVPLFDFTRKGLEFHQAGFKLPDLCRYFWQTRDTNVIEELQRWPKPKRYQTTPGEKISGWEIEAERLVDHRTGAHGLFPPEQYCGDISTPVQAINANAKAWRALRDLGAVLREAGDSRAGRYENVARDFRPTVLTAIRKSVDRSTEPPFVPVALYTNEMAHTPICETRIGSYWNIIIGYTIASGIFPVGSDEENWIPHYQERHGGIAMGMLRAGGQQSTFWDSEHRINPLYGTRYALDLLRRDEPERALVSLYGMLAQGFTRNTFIGAEGTALTPLDSGGRFFYCPPNSAANAHFLSMLRDILLQDSDLNDDGKPETLRLGFATPKRWLLDGRQYKFTNAPSAFGRVSLTMVSKLREGRIEAEVDLPTRNRPDRILLRARAPDGWRVRAASTKAGEVPVDRSGAADLSSLRGKQEVVFSVEKAN